MNNELQTIASWLKETTTYLKMAGVTSARLDAIILLEAVLQKNREWILAHDDYKLSPHEATLLNNFVSMRKEHVPLAYIVGSKEFYGREFLVTPDTLIPRPESEAIIDTLKKVSQQHEINTAIDIGTGSGCLAITAKKELPDIHATGVDISESALKIARKNARKHNVQIQWKQANLMKDELPKMPKTRPYIIIANLPYVPDNLITSEEITKEPALALFSGKDGLNHYRALFRQLKTRTNKPFAVITESLASQHTALNNFAINAGYQPQATTDLVQLFSLRLP